MIDYLRKLFALKLKFAASGAVATSVDYGLYLLLVNRFLSPVWANVVSYSVAVVINFILQKRYVFKLQRDQRTAFIMSIGVSLGGLLVSTLLIKWLTGFPYFSEHQAITKLLVTGLVFFYNFYCKRFVFERRWFDVEPLETADK